MHNFSIPSVLKMWIDQVVRGGRTFAYGPNGPKGLLSGKKATILVASGGVYEAGTPMAALNFIDPYLGTILGFIGIKDREICDRRWDGTAQVRQGQIAASSSQPHLEQVEALQSKLEVVPST